MLADMDGDGQAKIVISALNKAGTAPGELFGLISSGLVALDMARVGWQTTSSILAMSARMAAS